MHIYEISTALAAISIHSQHEGSISMIDQLYVVCALDRTLTVVSLEIYTPEFTHHFKKIVECWNYYFLLRWYWL